MITRFFQMKMNKIYLEFQTQLATRPGHGTPDTGRRRTDRAAG
jgi:hypothetical protein